MPEIGLRGHAINTMQHRSTYIVLDLICCIMHYLKLIIYIFSYLFGKAVLQKILVTATTWSTVAKLSKLVKTLVEIIV